MAKEKANEELEAITEEQFEAAETPEAAVEETDTEETAADESAKQSDEKGAETEEADDADKADAKTAKAGKRSAKAVREAEAEEARQVAKEERAESEDDKPKAPKRQMPNPLHQHGKKYRESAKLIDRTNLYGLTEAIELAQKTATTKFDSSVELHINLGVDPRQADQMVRSTVVLPHGTGKTLRIAVYAEGKVAEDAKAAGADRVGFADLLADIEAGKLDFDMLIATPAGMATLGKVARVLGPRGLMPNPKSGTVTPDAAAAVKEAKAGKVEFRIDKQAIIHQAVGKVSFDAKKLEDNASALLSAILKAKPSAAKGTYVKALTVTTTMGPAAKVDAAATVAALSGKK